MKPRKNSKGIKKQQQQPKAKPIKYESLFEKVQRMSSNSDTLEMNGS